MNDLEKIAKLKKRAEIAQRELDHAKGVEQRLLDQLKEEFGVSSFKEAQTMLKETKRLCKRSRARLHRAERLFERKWEAWLRD